MAGVACWAAGLGAQDATLRAGIAQVVSMNKRGTRSARSTEFTASCGSWAALPWGCFTTIP